MRKPDTPHFPDQIPNFLDTIPQLAGENLVRFKRAFGHAVHEVTLELERRAIIAQSPAEVDRAVGLEEACRILGTTRAWLERRANWERVGGYRDLDRRIKFLHSTLETYLRRQRAR